MMIRIYPIRVLLNSSEWQMKCVTCKGRGLCGRPFCPVLRRLEEIAGLPKVGMRLEGLSPPEVFVGRAGYPLVRAGPMVPADGALEPHSPGLDMDIGEIIGLRASMVRSEARIGVREAQAPGRLLEACQQMAMSSAPVGTEVSFWKPPRGKLQFDGVLSPSGPSGELKGMEITTNPVIPRRVDRIVEDKDAGAASAAGELYSSGIDTDHISRLLSLGLLGRKRSLVPTRWSITASDDMIGKALKNGILDQPLINDYYLFSGTGLGNHFEILLMPRPFSFELIEIWMPRSVWAEDGFIGGDREDARPKRVDHVFNFEAKDGDPRNVAEAKYRRDGSVNGKYVSVGRRGWYKIPETWERARNATTAVRAVRQWLTVAAIIAATFLKEPITRLRYASIFTVCAGAVAMKVL
jgi:hypothetical protein